MESLSDTIVTLAAIVLTLGLVPLGAYFDHRKRKMYFEERRLMIERGMQPPETLPDTGPLAILQARRFPAVTPGPPSKRACGAALSWRSWELACGLGTPSSISVWRPSRSTAAEALRRLSRRAPSPLRRRARVDGPRQSRLLRSGQRP